MSGYLAIKFDDAYETDLTVSLPTFAEFGIAPKGISMVPSQTVINGNTGRLDVDDAKELIHNGWLIGDHTDTHRLDGEILTMTDDELRAMLKTVNDFHAEYLNMPAPKFFNPPGGKIDTRVATIIHFERFGISRGTPGSFVTPLTNRYNIPFQSSGTDLDTLTGMLDYAEKMGYGVNVGFHEVVQNSNQHTVLRTLIDHALRIGVEIINLEEEVEIFGLQGRTNIDTVAS